MPKRLPSLVRIFATRPALRRFLLLFFLLVRLSIWNEIFYPIAVVSEAHHDRGTMSIRMFLLLWCSIIVHPCVLRVEEKRRGRTTNHWKRGPMSHRDHTVSINGIRTVGLDCNVKMSFAVEFLVFNFHRSKSVTNTFSTLYIVYKSSSFSIFFFFLLILSK